MSELKEHQFCESDEFFREYHGPLSNEMRPYYLKSEADKVIAEKDKKIDLYKRGWEESDRINEHLYAQLRHQKYKRCLDQVENCRTSSVYYFRISEQQTDGDKAAEYRHTSDWFDKWEERWLELAEQFKEAK